MKVRLKSLLIILGLLFALIVLQGCIEPYPVDMRQTLTVVVSEFVPTATGLAETIGRTTPQPGDTLINPGGTVLPSELSGGSPFYAVILVSADNVLNVRAEPGIDQPILAMLEPDARDLKITGNRKTIGEDEWVEIEQSSEENGWVSSTFLTQQVPKEAFCSNSKIRTLMRDVVTALQERDNAAFARLVNPERGLLVRQEWWNNELLFAPAQIETLFSSDESYDWGTGAASGEPVQGSFKKIVLPELTDVVDGEYSQACNTLDYGIGSGPTTAQVVWPFEYSNLNYVALFRPGAAGAEQDWRTWAVGVEIIDGQPYVTVLIQYHWEG